MFLSKLMFVTAYPIYELTDKTSSVNLKYREAYDGLALKKGFIASNYFTWFLFRRFLLSLVLVCFISVPLFQISLHLFLGLVELCILIKHRPFSSRSQGNVFIINEITLLVLYGLVGGLHFTGTSLLNQFECLGWTIVAAIMTANFVNLVYLMVVQIRDLRAKWK